MSIQRAEELKREWTDRFVTVRKGVAELRRFEGFVGQVRTVNMNGRALVEFGGSADIGWYDIDPQFLVPAEAVAVKNTSAVESSDHTAGAEGAAKVVPPKGPATKPSATSGTSPLDLIRSQAAGSSSKSADSADEGSKPVSSASPLDLIRAQSGGGVSETRSKIESTSKIKSDIESPGADAESSAATGRAIYDAGPPPAAPQLSATAEPVPSGSIPSPLELLRREGFGSQSTDSNSGADTDSAAPAFLGRKLPNTDDLKIIEGVGPKIEQLLQDAGINTWKIVSETKATMIKGVLTAAGNRFQLHDPTTWPHQALLAQEGRWKELEIYQDLLDGGRET